MSRAPTDPKGVSRRSFLQGVSAAAVTPSLVSRSSGPARPTGAKVLGPDPVPVTLTVNGQEHRVLVEPRTTLLEVLRNQLDLTGAKEVCDLGACGGCTVEVDGATVNACMMLALDAEGTRVLTVEGLARDGVLHPVQQAFVEEDALQCGYCTPGMVMSAHACLRQHPDADLETVKRAFAGNVCRCGTYPRVFAATLRAARKIGGGR